MYSDGSACTKSKGPITKSPLGIISARFENQFTLRKMTVKMAKAKTREIKKHLVKGAVPHITLWNKRKLQFDHDKTLKTHEKKFIEFDKENLHFDRGIATEWV